MATQSNAEPEETEVLRVRHLINDESPKPLQISASRSPRTSCAPIRQLDGGRLYLSAHDSGTAL